MSKSVQSASTPFNFNNFQGFGYPNTTHVPDLLFDHIMQDLDEKELKVLLYIIRRTFGFKKQVDNISLSQLVNGIVTHDGRVLDRGTGLSKATVARALQSLKKKNLINAIQNRSPEKGNLPTIYSLRMSIDPCLSSETRVVSPVKQGLVSAVRHTINSNTTYSKTTAKKKSETEISDSTTTNYGGLAAALIDRGIEKRVAHRLTNTYDRERIENNLDWLEWKQKNDPHSIKTNPAGLLRRAIEQDYAAEDRKGFQTRKQKAVASLVKKQCLQAQEKFIYARNQQQEASLQQREKARAKRLEMLREQYHTSDKEEKLWSQVLETLKEQIPKVSFNAYLAPSRLLALQRGKAIIAVPNRFIKEQIEGRLLKESQQALGDHLNGQAATVQYLVLDE
ncbi:MAG: replication protein [Anaerolineae bacterium]|nr:replication protein [Anaerolineae bacterium]